MTDEQLQTAGRNIVISHELQQRIVDLALVELKKGAAANKEKTLESFAQAAAPVIKKEIERQTASRLADLERLVAEKAAKIEALERRIMEMEARPVPRDGLPGVPGSAGPPGRDGRDGADGQHGLGFTDLEMSHDGERTLTFRFKNEAFERTFSFQGAWPLYRGTFQAETAYAAGDMVTHGGAQWIAMRATTDRPGEGATAWNLATKRPATGKSAYHVWRDLGHVGDERAFVESLRGPEGPPGRPGRDLTQLDPATGAKW